MKLRRPYVRFASACVTASCAAMACTPVAASEALWPRIERALSRIPTVAGQSALERLRTCGIRMDRRAGAFENISGGYDLYIPVTIPNGPGDDFHLVAIGWKVRNGKATPTTSWAQKIQDAPAPLGSRTWLRC